jgi:hypothetical protein
MWALRAYLGLLLGWVLTIELGAAGKNMLFKLAKFAWVNWS